MSQFGCVKLNLKT